MRLALSILFLLSTSADLLAQSNSLLISLDPTKLELKEKQEFIDVVIRFRNLTPENLLICFDSIQGVSGYAFPETEFCDSLQQGSALTMFILDLNGTRINTKVPFHASRKDLRRLKKQIKQDDDYVKLEMTKSENQDKGLTPEFLLTRKYVNDHKVIIPAMTTKEHSTRLYFNDFYLSPAMYYIHLTYHAGSLIRYLDRTKLRMDSLLIFDGCSVSNSIQMEVAK